MSPSGTAARFPRGTFAATVASAAMIAQQVSGKAARDAMYLSLFGVRTLPVMMAASAVLSLAVVVVLSRLMIRHAPARVVPIGFALSGAAYVGEWALSFSMPRLVAVVFYLHTALFGVAALSAFWSLINERFDPHTGKRAGSWIATGGTLGGVFGGFAVWRASSIIAVPTVLPCLAAVNLLCLWGVLEVRRGTPATTPDERAAAPEVGEPSPLRVLREAPYLRNLAIVVALGAVSSGLLDYVFSAEAVKVIPKGPALLSFFALFGLVVGLLSFFLQLSLGRIALEKLGLAVTIALLPGVVIFGGALGLAVPGLWSAALLRGGEAASRNSLFRAAYELLYTPLSEQKKRATKTLIDVGFDRLGTVTASGIALVALHFASSRAEMILLSLSVLFALATLTRSRPLQQGYVGVLEESLRKEAAKRGLSPERTSRPSRESLATRDELVEELKVLPRTEALAAIAGADGPLVTTAPRKDEAVWHASNEDPEALIASIRALCSGDVATAGTVLRQSNPIEPPLVSFAIRLLAHAELHTDATKALRRVAARVPGQLVDALCDPESPFDVRRRVPRVLSSCGSQCAADGLLRGAEDARFEVRYECGRALLAITGPESPVVITAERVIAIVRREVSVSAEVWASQPAPAFDDEEDDAPALIDRLLRDRIDRSMEHVFTLLALTLDRSSLRVAFKALHEDDERLRGTALEYLETVLPDEVRDAVWPFLGEARPMRAARPVAEILSDLARVRERVDGAGRAAPPAS